MVLAAGTTGALLGHDDPASAGQNVALAARPGADRADRGETRASMGEGAPVPVAADLAAVQAAAVRSAADKAAAEKAAAAKAAAAKKAAAKKAAAKKAAAAKATAARTAAAVPAGCSGYSGNQRIACSLLPSFGFPTSEMASLVPMWTKESGWNQRALNAGSGAYGIPQALPGSKMASAGSDWATSAKTQIRWGLGYIRSTYGSPSQAWSFWQSNGWY